MLCDEFKASLCYAMRPCLQATINLKYIYRERRSAGVPLVLKLFSWVFQRAGTLRATTQQGLQGLMALEIRFVDLILSKLSQVLETHRGEPKRARGTLNPNLPTGMMGGSQDSRDPFPTL